MQPFEHTLILLTLTEMPGTDMGRLHLYLSSILTVIHEACQFVSLNIRSQILTEVNFKSPASPVHLFWNWYMESFP